MLLGGAQVGSSFSGGDEVRNMILQDPLVVANLNAEQIGNIRVASTPEVLAAIGAASQGSGVQAVSFFFL